MKPFKTQAHIHSLGGQMDEITILEELGDNSYLVDYRGVKCSAIFNPFNCTYYADDVYGRLEERKSSSITTTRRERSSCLTATETAAIPITPMYSTLSGKQYSNSAANTDYSANISASSNFTKEVYQNG